METRVSIHKLLIALTTALVAASCATTPGTVNDPNQRLGIVIDAGSSGSRMHVYRLSGQGPIMVTAATTPGTSGDPWVEKTSPGLSSHAQTPDTAGDSLLPLLDKARAHIKDTGAVQVHVQATAGLRLLPADTQKAILDDVRQAIEEAGFAPGRLEVITGDREALYAWMSVNALLERLDGQQPTVGVLDLGGASTQIIFATDKPPLQSAKSVQIGANTIDLYAHSHLGFGQDQAFERVASAACVNTGYTWQRDGLPDIDGAGDFQACRKAIEADLERPACANPPCASMGVHQPPMSGDFVAISGYFYTAGFHNMEDKPLNLDALAQAGQTLCDTPWDELTQQHPDMPTQYLHRYCFNTAYIGALLTTGFGFDPQTSTITARDHINNTELGWTLGAMMVLANATGVGRP